MQEANGIKDELYSEYKRLKATEEARANVLKIECDCLSPYTDRATLKELCRRANTLKLGALVVFPAFVKACVSFLGSAPQVSLVAAISYPYGADKTEIKVAAVKQAVKDGVDEAEVFAPTAYIKDGNWSYFKRECKKVKKVAKSKAVRMVFDCARLSEKELAKACSVAAETGIACVRLNGADGELLSRIKQSLNGKCRIKADKAESKEQFINFYVMGADAVNCTSACDLASLLLKQAEEGAN